MKEPFFERMLCRESFSHERTPSNGTPKHIINEIQTQKYITKETQTQKYEHQKTIS